jgi:hypothetical protein
LTGNVASGAVGTVIADKSKALTGNAGNGAVGTAVQSASADLTGVLGFGYPGGVIVPLLPLSAEGLVGSVTGDREIALTGNSSSAAVGSVDKGPREFGLTGNQASGSVGTVFAVYWKLIDDTQSINWQNVGTPQIPGWVLIDDEQTPNWEEIEVTT